jgi:hypothetical protein
VDAGETSDATMDIGPGAYRSIIILRFDSGRNPIGPPIAPRVLEAVELARQMWGFDLPPMVAAPNPF